jgi:hypothetical protein
MSQDETNTSWVYVCLPLVEVQQNIPIYSNVLRATLTAFTYLQTRALCAYKYILLHSLPLAYFRPWGLLYGPVLFAPGFISCLLSRTSPLGLVLAPFSI